MAIQEKMMINNHLLPVLPTDITIDILSRLSIDLVLSCKRVCKSWRALIDDPVFTQLHTYRFLLDDDEKQQKPEAFEFFLSTEDTDFGKYNFGEHTLGDITIKLHKLITHDYPFPLPFENNDYSRPYWLLVSSCNGLVCLVSNAEDDYNSIICVYNPLTREYVNLPTLTYKQPLLRSKNLPYIITGFGYHPCTKEYKVVQIYYKNSRFGQGQVSVYTLGSGSSSSSSSGWRSKGETDFKLFGIRGNLLVNGALHWLNNEADRSLEIIAFDLAEEKLRIVPSPPSSAIFPPQALVHHIALGVLEKLEGRCLCVITVMTLISTSSNESLCSMWVMNQDYRSWTKKYNIALNEPDEFRIRYRPLAHWKGGKILLQNYNKMEIVSSDLKNPSFDDEDINVISLVRLSKKQFNAPSPHYYEIIPYTKSFVSLKALGEDGARTGKKMKELKRVRGTNNDGEEQTMAAEKRNKNNQGEGGGGGGETNM